MEYLERNQQLLVEIGQNATLFLGRRPSRVGSNSREFHMAGSYSSALLGHELHLGIKVEWKRQDPSEKKQMFIKELAVMNTIARRFPDMAAELPVVSGRLVDSGGRDLGVVMEDFSQGGRYELDPLSGKFLPWAPLELWELVPEYANGFASFSDLGWVVNEQRRLGDFDRFGFFLAEETQAERFGFEEIEDSIQSFTLTLDYPLEEKPFDPPPPWIRPEALEYYYPPHWKPK